MFFLNFLGFIVVGKCTYLAQSIIIGSLMVILERSVGVVCLKALNGRRKKKKGNRTNFKTKACM